MDRREFGGSIQEQAEAAFQYVLEKINLGMKIQGIYRQDVYELPVDSVRELIANAVVHRSYLEPGNIQVAIFDDRLEVTSPGMLLEHTTLNNRLHMYRAGKECIRIRRNHFTVFFRKHTPLGVTDAEIETLCKSMK